MNLFHKFRKSVCLIAFFSQARRYLVSQLRLSYIEVVISGPNKIFNTVSMKHCLSDECISRRLLSYKIQSKEIRMKKEKPFSSGSPRFVVIVLYKPPVSVEEVTNLVTCQTPFHMVVGFRWSLTCWHLTRFSFKTPFAYSFKNLLRSLFFFNDRRRCFYHFFFTIATFLLSFKKRCFIFSIRIIEFVTKIPCVMRMLFFHKPLSLIVN